MLKGRLSLRAQRIVSRTLLRTLQAGRGKAYSKQTDADKGRVHVNIGL